MDRPEPIERTVGAAGAVEEEEGQPIARASRHSEFSTARRTRKPSWAPGGPGQRNAHAAARRIVPRGTDAWRYGRSRARQAGRVQFHLRPRHESETHPG